MLGIQKINPMVRAVGTIGAVAAIATGATFAALQSQATLTNNTITSATANLQVKSTGVFGASDAGFAFTGVVPGGTSSTVGNFQLKNNGTASLSLNLNMPGLPTWVVLPSGTVDPTKTSLAVSCTSVTSGTLAATNTLSAFNALSGVNLTGSILAGDTVTCTAQVSMLIDAFSGTSATSGLFDLKFTGTGL